MMKTVRWVMRGVLAAAVVHVAGCVAILVQAREWLLLGALAWVLTLILGVTVELERSRR